MFLTQQIMLYPLWIMLYCEKLFIITCYACCVLFMSISVFVLPDTNECDSNPCMNGNCTDGYHSYQCECDAGYNGNDCADNIDDCMTNSCQNNATCQDGVNGYSCLCQPDFNGDLCEIATSKFHI